jgi:hypothetical protein
MNWRNLGRKSRQNGLEKLAEEESENLQDQETQGEKKGKGKEEEEMPHPKTGGIDALVVDY